MTSLAGEKKRKLRIAAAQRRESFSRFQLAPWSESVQSRVLSFTVYRDARCVALYSPLGNEVDTARIREHALSCGKVVFYPISAPGDPVLARIDSSLELAPGRYGILEPVGNVVLDDDSRTDLAVFVPGVALDLRGNRLGRGGGWYDRILSGLGESVLAIALAYEFQIVASVPTEPWDRRVQYIVTERRIIHCGEKRAEGNAVRAHE